jgi:hypothetical protein
MEDRSRTERPELPVAVEPVPDGGEDEPTDREDGEGHEERAEGRVGQGDREPSESEGGFWPWSGRRTIRRLRHELADVSAERDDLQSEVETLREQVTETEAELEELRETVATVERKTFPVSAFLRSVGDSVRQADEGLAGSDFAVGGLEVTLRSRFAGAEDGLSVQLPEPDREIDPETLSTVTFHVGRETARRERPDLLMGGVGAVRDEGGESDLVEVPDVRELSLAGATDRLSDAGLDVSVDYRPGAAPDGTVIEQDPDPFSFGPEGATVDLVVAGDPPEA